MRRSPTLQKSSKVRDFPESFALYACSSNEELVRETEVERQCSAQLKSGCKMQELRDCGSDYVVYSNTTRLAESGQEFEHDCGLYLRQIECSKKFGERCLQNIGRVVTMLALNAAEEDFEAACTEGNERNQCES
ncbi:hypothetical protein MTO96_046270 [Rhipicephalus appendiculatus]